MVIGTTILVIGVVLGAVLWVVAAIAWGKFIIEVPGHKETFGRSVGPPLNTPGTYQYIFAFILGKRYERYRISGGLLARYRHIRAAYLVHYSLLALGMIVLSFESAYRLW